MEHYSNFQKELYGRETIWDDNGFVVYSPKGDGSVYVHAIYVKPESRKKGAASVLMEKIVFKENPTLFCSYVDLHTSNYNDAVKIHLAYGFKIYKATSDSILFIKELQNNEQA